MINGDSKCQVAKEKAVAMMLPEENEDARSADVATTDIMKGPMDRERLSQGRDDSSEPAAEPSRGVKIGWFRQLWAMLWKNWLLLARRLGLVVTAFCAPLVGVLLTWPLDYAYGQVDKDTFPELDQCGVASTEWLSELFAKNPDEGSYTLLESYSTSLNSQCWEASACLASLALGPTVVAMVAFILVQGEALERMLAVLRSLGVRESVYWTSWFLLFTCVSFISSLVAAGVAKGLPVHVYQESSFAPIFVSLWFLQVALVAASFFLAAFVGTVPRVTVMICILILLAMVGAVTIIGGMEVVNLDNQISNNYFPTTATWSYTSTRQTSTYRDSRGLQVESCDKPIMAPQYTYGMTDSEAKQVPTSDYYFGCFVVASGFAIKWTADTTIALVVEFLIPYYHFGAIWSNLVGATSLPGGSFQLGDMGEGPTYLASEKLAQYNSVHGNVTAPTLAPTTAGLFPQGSMVNFGIPKDYPSNCATSLNPSQCELSDFCSVEEGMVSTSAPSVNASLGYLILLTLINMLLALYWAQLFPMGNGVAQKPWFFLAPSYWLGRSSTLSESEALVDKVSSTQLQVRQVTKCYGDFTAVSNVSFTADRGELIALLGHNGAGKSTLTKMITCDIAPTSGSVSVFGRDVSQDIFGVRSFIGVCHQDDFLYGSLSAREHLELFAVLRGVPPEQAPSVATEWLEDVDLEIVDTHRSCTFSGGMKRRLSVALATIGDVSAVLLDEPTTGMDPVSRRLVWGHIERVKRDRIVLLTTHAMEEADLLADTVAIMANGQLVAFGSPLELKSQHGSALHFNLLVESRSEDSEDSGEGKAVDAAIASIRDIFAEQTDFVSWDSSDAGSITLKVTKLAVDNGKESGAANDTRPKDCVADGVPIAVLLSFVDWLRGSDTVKEWGFSNSTLEEVYLEITHGIDTSQNTPELDPVDQVDVCCSCCCKGCIRCCMCCCLPKPRADPSTEPKTAEEIDNPAVAVDAAREQFDKMASFEPRISSWLQLRALLLHEFQSSWTGKSSIANWITFPILAALPVIILAYIGIPEFDVTYILVVFVLSLMLPSLVASRYHDRSTGMFHLMRTQGMLGSAFTAKTVTYSFMVQFVYCFLVLSLLLAIESFRGGNYDSCVQSNPDGSAYIIDSLFCGDLNTLAPNLAYVVTPGGYGLLIGMMFSFSLATPGLVLMLSYLPGNKRALAFVSFIAICLGVVPVAVMAMKHKTLDQACLAAFASSPLSLEGGATMQYACAPDAIGIIPQFALLSMIAAYLSADVQYYRIGPNANSGPSPWENTSGCSKDGLCPIPIMHERYGVFLGYSILGAVLFFVTGIAITLVFGFPPKPVQRALNTLKCGWLSCLNLIKCGHKTKEGRLAYTEEPSVQAGDTGVQAEQNAVASVFQPYLPASTDPENAAPRTKEIVLPDDQARKNIPLVALYNLDKVYPALAGQPPKHAVDELSLLIPQGQVLALLGKNGAGKTTALKVLEGTHKSTSGLAMVCGYDLNTESLKVYERMGSCPQFDKVWPGQSVQHHLEFFARLKGLPEKDVKDISHQIACAVGLGGVGFDRKAGQLSGGMRRRLSIAMSLIGAPRVLLLDEPSTGLDPSTRLNIWSLIHSFANSRRAIVLTTHMMLEADALCNRIAIMSKGKLKVIGTSQSLKDRFGSGFTLLLNLESNSEENRRRALKFVHERVHSDAFMIGKQGKSFKLKLPREGLDLMRIFAALYSPECARQGRINQFLLSMATLEDIFISVA